MCVTIELDYKEALARRKILNSVWTNPYKSAESSFYLITKSGLWPSGGINGRKSGKPCHWLPGEGGWWGFMSGKSVTDWLLMYSAKWKLATQGDGIFVL